MLKQIQKAADIWGDIILEGGNINNGDNSEQGALALGLMAMNQAHDAAKVENLALAVQEFKKHLVAALQFQLSDSCMVRSLFLMCDYNPCVHLDIAARRAGIPPSLLGIKTDMSIDERGVRISKGYGAPDVNYYLLDGDEWLVCDSRLVGEELEEVARLVKDGVIKSMRIENQ